MNTTDEKTSKEQHPPPKKTFLGIPYKSSLTGTPTGPEPPAFAKILTIIFGSGLGTGYAPFAQGTIASALFVLIWVFVVPARIEIELAVVLFVHIISIPLSGWGERLWGEDAGRITIDEFAGQAIALVGLSRDPIQIIAAFLLFRLFDSLKLPVIKRRIETLPGGWGVTLDDTAAGLIARLILFLVFSVIII